MPNSVLTLLQLGEENDLPVAAATFTFGSAALTTGGTEESAGEVAASSTAPTAVAFGGSTSEVDGPLDDFTATSMESDVRSVEPAENDDPLHPVDGVNTVTCSPTSFTFGLSSPMREQTEESAEAAVVTHTAQAVSSVATHQSLDHGSIDKQVLMGDSLGNDSLRQSGVVPPIDADNEEAARSTSIPRSTSLASRFLTEREHNYCEMFVLISDRAFRFAFCRAVHGWGRESWCVYCTEC